MIHSFKRAAAAVVFMLAALPVLAHNGVFHDVTAGDLTISAAYSRATLPNAPVGAAYLTVTNTGSSDDRLISASSPVAGVTQLHEMTMANDVMQMNELPDGIALPAGSTVTLAPGGLHVMLMNLNGPLVEGATLALTLVFEKAGTVEIEVPIKAFNAGSGGMDHGGTMDHGGSMDMSDTSAMGDEDAIAQMQKAMFDTPDNPLQMGPIVIAGEYAISDWAQNDTAGRALLRKTAQGWAIHLCSGAGLKEAANLVAIGVPEGAAAKLAAGLAAAEASIDPALLMRYDSFDGTMMVDESLI